MKNKIIVLVLMGVLGVYSAPTLFAKSQGQDYRTYPEFKSVQATDVEVVYKLSSTRKGKPANLPIKPEKDSELEEVATGILGDLVNGEKFAIIIGIANYPGTSSDLRYTDEDAYAMERVLTENYGFSSDNIIMLVDNGDGATDIQPLNATAQNIQNAIMETGSLAGPDDEVVFFYSGHGGKGKANDGDKEAIDESIISHNGTELVHIWDGELKQLFDSYKTDRITFFFDSCVAGGMTDLAKEGRIINMATQEKRLDTAVEGIYDGIGAGEFTYHFVIKGMGEKLADILGTEGEGVVTVEEAFDYAKTNVITDHPTVSDNFLNDLLW